MHTVHSFIYMYVGPLGTTNDHSKNGKSVGLDVGGVAVVPAVVAQIDLTEPLFVSLQFVCLTN